MDVAELTAQLVATHSVNPALVPGGSGEGEIASFVAAWCADHGLEVEVVGDERPSVIATKRGSGGGRSLLLNGHIEADARLQLVLNGALNDAAIAAWDARHPLRERGCLRLGDPGPDPHDHDDPKT